MPFFSFLRISLFFVAFVHIDQASVTAQHHHQLRDGTPYDHDRHHGHHRLQEQLDVDGGDGGINCGTESPDEDEKLLLKQEEEAWLQIHGSEISPEQTTNVYIKWHRVQTSAGTGGVTDAQILNAISRLNQEFASAGFSFSLLTGTTVTNSGFYFYHTLPAELSIKANRVGDATTLNIWSVGTFTLPNG